MIKKVISGILAIALLFVCLHFSKNKLKIERDNQVIIVATIVENDELQLFYKTTEDNQYEEENSIKEKVKGSNTQQTIIFDIPEEGELTGLRLDLGNNPNQKPIQLEAFGIRLNPEVEGYLNITNDLISNEFLTSKGKTFTARMLDGRYDPYLITKENFKNIMNILESQQAKTYSLSAIILSVVFSITFFIFLLQIEIKLSKTQLIQTSYILCFALIIALPGLMNILGIEFNQENLEKRKLAEKPELKLTKDFPSKFEAYYNDHFGFRNLLVEQSAKLKLKVFNSYPKLDKVQEGDDNYLFYNDITEHIYPSYSHQDRFTPEQLDKKYQRLKAQKDFLDQRGIAFILAILPNKATIYSEKLPSNMKAQIPNTPSLANQYDTYFADKDIKIHNVTEDLLSQKPKYDLYQKLDSHWNSYGAYFAYQSLLHQYQAVLNVKPFALNEFEVKYDTIHEGDLSRMIGLKDLDRFEDMDPVFTLKNKQNQYTTDIAEGNKVIRTINENARSTKKVLIFRDSFTTKLIPFFSSTFHEIVYVSGDFDEQRIEEEKPDVVMVLKVERLIKFF